MIGQAVGQANPDELGIDDVLSTRQLIEAEDASLLRSEGAPKTALCLSGGGIRSAAFALGVVQALARKGLLPHFHYLSTVSGGGYLGGFLWRWIEAEKRTLPEVEAKDGNLTDVEEEQARQKALSNVQDALAGRGKVAGEEPWPIRGLRENSNFITPRVGLASADTWTAIAMSVRNIIVNWLVFAPAFLLVVAFPHLAASLIASSAGLFADALMILGALAIGYGTWRGARNLPSHLRPRERKDGTFVFTHVVAPTAAGMALLGLGLAPDLLPNLGAAASERPLLGFLGFDWLGLVVLSLKGRAALAQALGLAVLFAFAGLLGGYVVAWWGASRAAKPEAAGGDHDPNADKTPSFKDSAPSDMPRDKLEKKLRKREKLTESNNIVFKRNLLLWVAGSAIAAVVYALGLSIVPRLHCTVVPYSLHNLPPCEWRASVLATLALMWGILSHLVLTILFVAFRWVGEGDPDVKLSPDLDREWLGRLSAQKIRLGLAWTVFAAAALLLPDLLSALFRRVSSDPETAWQSVTGALGVISGTIAVIGGKQEHTGYRSDPGAARKIFSFDVLVGIATFLFLLILLVLMARIEFRLANWLAERAAGIAGATPPGPRMMVAAHSIAILGLWWFLGQMARKINVNRFSLNGFYRNRLARAFLGSAREVRIPDPFTSFSPEDNIRLEALKGRRVLMPVVNVALNVVGGRRLAWQERKAQAFVFTPIACGSHELGEELTPPDPTRKGKAAAAKGPTGKYVRTEIYGGNEPDLGLAGNGVSLATAIAISGAAASPSMGYHSSPTTAFLMTLFNVRLGAWLPNPGAKPSAPGAKLLKEDMMRSAPKNALQPLMEEMLGLTNAEGQSVYLSDGGHFENLGLYEMVRRKCRYIVVSDAGCDPAAAFEDLGNAIRKIRIDLNVNIRIDTVRITSREKWNDKNSTYFALGSIQYPVGEPGHLLYIKPGCASGIPADVRAYALLSRAFPHETTLDQWFSESQFESYRSLGADLVDRLGKGVAPDGPTVKRKSGDKPASYDGSGLGLAAFFEDVEAAAPKQDDEQEFPVEGIKAFLAEFCSKTNARDAAAPKSNPVT